MNRNGERRALLLAPQFFYPADGGDKLSCHALHRSLLALGFLVDVLCYGQTSSRPRPLENGTVFEVEKPRRVRPLKLFRSAALGESYLFNRFVPGREVGRIIEKNCPWSDYEAIVVVHGYLERLVPRHKLRPTAKVLISSEVLESKALLQKSVYAGRMAAALLRLEAKRAERKEFSTFACADGTFFYSQDELLWYRSRGGTNGQKVEFGLDMAAYRPSDRPRNYPYQIAFYGGFTWHPNSDALAYLLGEVWPAITALRSDVLLRIAGHAIPRWAFEKKCANTQIVGPVEDISAFISSSDVVLAPLRVGGGTRVKILEAMALARPVVATSVALEGNGSEVGKDVLLADSPNEFAKQVSALLSSGARWSEIAQNGRRFVELHHDLRVAITAPMSGWI